MIDASLSKWLQCLWMQFLSGCAWMIAQICSAKATVLVPGQYLRVLHVGNVQARSSASCLRAGQISRPRFHFSLPWSLPWRWYFQAGRYPICHLPNRCAMSRVALWLFQKWFATLRLLFQEALVKCKMLLRLARNLLSPCEQSIQRTCKRQHPLMSHLGVLAACALKDC